jgi:exopolyphosphatase/guanosine-5'-triphosphate,3'-diphosphate pyrophosphatase
MKNRIAVLDLGTNTFHLLIAEGSMPHITTVKHATEAVKLGEGGINDGVIRPDAYQRGLTAMQQFKQLLDEHQPDKVKALATSAMRSATNGNQFIEEVKQLTGISIQTIDGDTEAAYIYEGIKAAGCLAGGNNIIVDIGGGSVELIWCNAEDVHWKRSFEIGAARLMAKFHQQDPIPAEQINALFEYLDEQLKPLYEALGQQHVHTLIGSSGAFETFADLVEIDKGAIINWKQQINYTFNTQKLPELFNLLAASSHQQRAANPAILPVRVDMIVVAALITQYLMYKLHPDEVAMSAYSLKEGVMAEMLKFKVHNGFSG